MIALKTGRDFLSSEKSFSLITSDYDTSELMPLLKPKIGRGVIRPGAFVSDCEPELAPLSCRHSASADIQQAVIEAVHQHIGRHKIYDDITLLVLQ